MTTLQILSLLLLAISFTGFAYSSWKLRYPHKLLYRIKHKREQRRIIRYYETELPKLEQLAVELAGTERFHPAFNSLGMTYVVLDDKALREKYGLWLCFVRNLCYDSANNWRTNEPDITDEEIRHRLRERISSRDEEFERLSRELSAFGETLKADGIHGVSI